MTQSRPRLGDRLIAAGVIDAAQLNVALAEQSRWNTPIGMTLVRLGYLDEPTMVRALASQLNIPVVILRAKRINAEILEMVPADVADKYRCLPLLINGDGEARKLYLGMEDPTDEVAIGELTERIGMAIQPVLVAPTELDEGIHRHYHWESSAIGSLDGASPIGGASKRSDSSSLPSIPSVLPPLAGGAPGASFESDEEEPQFVDYNEPAAVQEPSRAVARPGVGGSESMLRAIAQLLIDKGVFTRDELVERLRTITTRDKTSG